PGTVSGTVPAPSVASAPAASSAEYIFSGIKQHKLAAVIAGIVVVLGAVGIGSYLRAPATELPIESIAVLPFQNKSTETDTEYLSDGLAESLIYRLSQLPNLKVSPTSSVFRYKGKEVDPIKVGQELGVSAVLAGRMVQRGDSLTISAELVDVRNNKLLWGEQYERKMSELLATQREIAREIVDKLRLRVSGQEKGLAKHYTESNEAYQFYLKGRFYWNKRSQEGFQKALEYFQQAIEIDPNFALAYSGLADTYNLLGGPEAGGDMPPNEVLPKAKAAALKALEIDETLAEPHVSLAHVKYNYDRDWVGAEREYKRAMELNPNYPVAHQWYAIYLSGVGRQREALAEIRRAQELDPLSLSINTWLGRILALAGQSDQALEQLRKTVEMDPNFIQAHYRLGSLYEEKGMYDEAIAEFKQALKLSGGKPPGVSALARAYAMAGKREEAQKNLAELLQLSKQRYVSPTSIAMIYIALGDKDKAFAWLDDGNKAHDLNIVRLKEDPRFAPLRSDPRFAVLVRRIGIP
ncbi:MAG: tetratricopeptide repeat protein, partial [Pyrinomonadaceae bacterium]